MSDRLQARHRMVPSRHLGRRVHLWSYGWWGQPVIAFPTASGMAHEWQSGGAIDALRHLIEAGRIKLYCPESNVSESWMSDDPGHHRLARYEAYERFIVQELAPFVREECGGFDGPLVLAGASFGAYYAANMTLKHPHTFGWGLCLSGRYDVQPMLEHWSESVYFNAPYAYVPNLHGDALHRVRRARLTLVVGLGPFENSCIPETLRLSEILASKGIAHERDVWGYDAAHQWPWWQRQLSHHLGRRLG